MIPVDETVTAIRKHVAEWRSEGETVALVPTMGSLHEGHMALVDMALEHARRVVVSIFVNPTQFGIGEDFSSYPRDLDGDLRKLSLVTDRVFVPTVAEMYPPGYATTISVGGPAEELEGAFRPQHFAGVATIVSKLLLAVGPDFAVFGEKDYQQLLVIRRLAADLRLPGEILACPTSRDPDGLARSSRNAYLTSEERQIAPRLYQAVETAAEAIRNGSLAAMAVEEAHQALLAAGFDVDYVELRNAETLKPVADQDTEPMRILAAARLGRTRLIDNVSV